MSKEGHSLSETMQERMLKESLLFLRYVLGFQNPRLPSLSPRFPHDGDCSSKGDNHGKVTLWFGLSLKKTNTPTSHSKTLLK